MFGFAIELNEKLFSDPKLLFHRLNNKEIDPVLREITRIILKFSD